MCDAVGHRAAAETALLRIWLTGVACVDQTRISSVYRRVLSGWLQQKRVISSCTRNSCLRHFIAAWGTVSWSLLATRILVGLAIMRSLRALAHVFYISSILGSHTYSVKAFSFGRLVCLLSVVCLSRVRSRQLSEISAKFLTFQEIGVADQEYDFKFCTESS